jgi:hypothetical protein
MTRFPSCEVCGGQVSRDPEVRALSGPEALKCLHCGRHPSPARYNAILQRLPADQLPRASDRDDLQALIAAVRNDPAEQPRRGRPPYRRRVAS